MRITFPQSSPDLAGLTRTLNGGATPGAYVTRPFATNSGLRSRPGQDRTGGLRVLAFRFEKNTARLISYKQKPLEFSLSTHAETGTLSSESRRAKNPQPSTASSLTSLPNSSVGDGQRGNGGRQMGVGGSHEAKDRIRQDRVVVTSYHITRVTTIGANLRTKTNYSKLQLLQRPQVVPDVRDRLNCDALIHRAHLLRTELRDPHADGKLLPLSIERDRCSGRQRRVRGREPPAGGGQAGTHHVCAGEEEADRAAVDADVCEDEWICGRVACRVRCLARDRAANVMRYTRICGAAARWAGMARQGPGKRAARRVVRRWRGDLCWFCRRRHIRSE